MKSRLPLQLIFFLLVICTADCFTKILKAAMGYGQDSRVESKADDIHEELTAEPGSVPDVKVPERLFSQEVASTRRSYCYQARLEFDKLCGLRSATERARLASFVTNCHLEVSGRPVFVWDPAKKLADADDSYVYLVMQFIPLMSDVCEKAGYSPMLAHLVADTKSNEDLRNKINELQDATERLFEANRQSSAFVEEYMNMSADASKQLLQLLNLFAAIKEANHAIDTQRTAIQQEANDIKAELRAFTRNSISLFDSMFGRFDGFQSQVSNMESVVGQLQSDSRATSMFLKAPLDAISNSSGFMESPEVSIYDYWIGFSFSSFRKVGFLKDLILGPIKLSERIRHLESSRFLGPFAKDTFSSIQLLLVLLSVYLAYMVLTILTKFMEAAFRFAAIFSPFQQLLAKLSHFFSKVCLAQPDAQHQHRKAQLTEHISASVSKALASSKMTEKLDKAIRNDGLDALDAKISLLFTKMSQLDMQLSQISQEVRLLYHSFQSLDGLDVREPGISLISQGRVASHDENLEKLPNSISVVTSAGFESKGCGSNNEALDRPSKRNPTAGEKKIYVEQSESSDIELNCTNRRKECDRREKESTIPKRELPRRRSSRKK